MIEIFTVNNNCASSPTQSKLRTILTEIITLNNFPIVIQINISNFKNLFRIEFTIRIATEDSVLDLREKKLKRLYFVEMPLGFNKLFQE